LKPRLRGRFAPGDRLCGRRGSIHAGGCPAKSLPEAISIAERFLERSIFCYAPLAVGLMEIEKYICYAPLAVGLMEIEK
jgi:hypothetical protein